MEWQNTTRFPKSDSTWSIFENKKKKSISEIQAIELAKKWNYFTKILISSPGTPQYLPPILVPELQDNAYHSVLKNLKRMFIVSVLIFIAYFFAFSGVFIEKLANIPLLISFLVLSVYFYSEYRFVCHHRNVVVDRALFIGWLRDNTSFNYYTLISIISVIGFIQAAFFLLNYDSDYLILKIGVVYSSIDNGEYWRFLIGPFLHSGVNHWIINIVSCATFLWLLNPFNSKLHFALAYFSIVFSAIMAYAISKSGIIVVDSVDAFVGVSGVVFYAQGFILSNMIINSYFYPKYLWFNILFISIFSLILPCLYVNQTSNVSHVSGFILGLVLGTIFKPDRKP